MPTYEGRIVIVADLGPKRLVRLAEALALDSGCSLEDVADTDLDADAVAGFHIVAREGRPLMYSPTTLLVKACGGYRIPLDIVVSARRTSRGDGRLTIDWIETGNFMRPSEGHNFAQGLANLVEIEIENDGGEVINSFNDYA